MQFEVCLFEVCLSTVTAHIPPSVHSGYMPVDVTTLIKRQVTHVTFVQFLSTVY